MVRVCTGIGSAALADIDWILSCAVVSAETDIIINTDQGYGEDCVDSVTGTEPVVLAVLAATLVMALCRCLHTRKGL